jgi:hypothetical protein
MKNDDAQVGRREGIPVERRQRQLRVGTAQDHQRCAIRAEGDRERRFRVVALIHPEQRLERVAGERDRLRGCPGEHLVHAEAIGQPRVPVAADLQPLPAGGDERHPRRRGQRHPRVAEHHAQVRAIHLEP